MKGVDALKTRIDELYETYAEAVFEKCLRMLSSRAEAEDAVQETFVKAYTLLMDNRGSRGQSDLAWLYRIATYVCLHALRSRRLKGEQPMETCGENVAKDDPRHDHQLMMREALLTFLFSLDEKSQAVLVAYYIDGVPQGEIAKSLGISRRAVVKRLHVMKQKMSPSILRELPHA